MPWCESCNRLVDDELTEEGSCPTCDEPLIEEHRTVPWHFKFLLAATVIYLGYRSYQGIAWLVHHA